MTERYRPNPEGNRTAKAMARILAIGRDFASQHPGKPISIAPIAEEIGYSPERTLLFVEILNRQFPGELPPTPREEIRRRERVRK